MSERLTPEAEPDNNEQRELAAWLKLKRKAVSERDEARKDLKITQEAWVKAKAERVEALRERDEAREEAAHWKNEYEIVVSRLCGKKHPRDNGIISEKEIIPKLECERDEVLDTIFDVMKALGATVYEGPRLAALRVKSERDEAREILREIAAADWRTSGELRGMARKALEGVE